VTGIRQRSVERKSVWTDAFERAKGEEVERTGREGVDNVRAKESREKERQSGTNR